MDSKDKPDNAQNVGLNLGADTSGCPVDGLPELIRKRACQLYEARHGQPGQGFEDWLQAECEIRHHFGH
jgi:hypothetical protein